MNDASWSPIPKRVASPLAYREAPDMFGGADQTTLALKDRRGRSDIRDVTSEGRAPMTRAARPFAAAWVALLVMVGLNAGPAAGSPARPTEVPRRASLEITLGGDIPGVTGQVLRRTCFHAAFPETLPFSYRQPTHFDLIPDVPCPSVSGPQLDMKIFSHPISRLDDQDFLFLRARYQEKDRDALAVNCTNVSRDLTCAIQRLGPDQVRVEVVGPG